MCSQVLLTELGLVKSGNSTTMKESATWHGAGRSDSTSGVATSMLLSFDSLWATMTANSSSSSSSESDNSSWGPAPNPIYISTNSSGGSTVQSKYYSTGCEQDYNDDRVRSTAGRFPLATMSSEFDGLTCMASPPMSVASSAFSPTYTIAMSAINRKDTVDTSSEDEEDLGERFDRNALWNY